MKNVTIIGGGLSSLAASCYLAKKNFKVTIIEKNDHLGGRLSFFEKDGFVFDMGPSWYWMPEVFEDFFKDFDKDVSDYYKLKRLDPSYRFYLDDLTVDFSADLNDIFKEFEKIEPGSSLKLSAFLKDAKIKYDISLQKFILFPNESIKEYLSIDVLKYFFKLDLFKSLRSHINNYFSNKKIKNFLEFPAMFLGGSPKNTPALYSLMNYGDIKKGTWYPEGGMYKIAEAFSSLSKELGVEHILGDPIVKLDIKNKSIKSATSKSGKIFNSDYFLAGLEYPFVQTKLLDEKHRSYNLNYWSKKHVAPSALIFYLGLSSKVKNIEHHNLFFDKDFDKHLIEIFDNKVLPSEPLFYVCCPSKTDSSIVPNDDMENIFILIPIGPGSEDSQSIRDKYFDQVINRMEIITKQKIKNKIIVKKSFCVNDFVNRYNAYKGNAYGLANTLLQSAVFKPKIKDKIIRNLFYTGHFTVPGPGLPPAIISGKIASNEILKDIK